MTRFNGKINLCVLDTARVTCDGPQDLRHIYPEDDLKGCKAPVIPFDEMLRKHKIVVDWATIRKPMGLFKRTHLQKLLEEENVRTQFKKEYGREWTVKDLDQMFNEYQSVLNSVIVTDSETVKGRPSPFMVFDCMHNANIYPVEAVVKVDDTAAAISEGRNAGA
jgi:phosphonoacetaldehyde hydrolase